MCSSASVSRGKPGRARNGQAANVASANKSARLKRALRVRAFTGPRILNVGSDMAERQAADQESGLLALGLRSARDGLAGLALQRRDLILDRFKPGRQLVQAA